MAKRVNTVLAQMKLKLTTKRREAKLAPPPPPSHEKGGPVEKPKTMVEVLETFPDAELAGKAKALLGDAFDPRWNRNTLIQKIIAAGE